MNPDPLRPASQRQVGSRFRARIAEFVILSEAGGRAQRAFMRSRRIPTSQSDSGASRNSPQVPDGAVEIPCDANRDETLKGILRLRK